MRLNKRVVCSFLCILMLFTSGCDNNDEDIRIFIEDDRSDTDGSDSPSPIETPPVNNSPAPQNPNLAEAKLLPPDDRTLFFIGQDIDTVNTYVNDLSTTPAGVTAYVSVNGAGIFTRFEEGHGDLDLDSYLAGFPQSALAIGLYMVGQEENIADQDEEILRHLHALLEKLKTCQSPYLLRIGYEVDGYWNNYDLMRLSKHGNTFQIGLMTIMQIILPLFGKLQAIVVRVILIEIPIKI